MLNLQLIVGSTRPTRAADRILPWVLERTTEHGDFRVEVLDLRDWLLPFFQEHPDTIGDLANPVYSEPIVKRWNDKLKDGHAYLIVTPEYNHGVPGQLKNAIDNVYVSFAFRNKPIGFISYSAGLAAGARAVEHLALIAIDQEAVPLRNAVLIPFVVDAFNDEGLPRNPATETAIEILLDDLAWYAAALRQARSQSELAPGTDRARAAAALRAVG